MRTVYVYGYKRDQVRTGQVHDLYMLHVVDVLFVFKHNTTCQLDRGFASYWMLILQLLDGPCLVGLQVKKVPKKEAQIIGIVCPWH